MSVISFEGIEEKGGIPEDANVRIVSCSGKVTPSTETSSVIARTMDLVFSGRVTGGMVNLNLDPGLYAFKVRHLPEDGVGALMYSGDFYHGCTKEEFKEITHMKPLHSSAMLTTDGIRFTCNWIGCKTKTTSRIASLLHESSVHYGRDLLASQNPNSEKGKIDRQFKETEREAKPKQGPRIT